MGAVVDDVGGALGGAALHEVDAEALSSAHDVAGLHPVAAESIDCRLADGVRGKFGDEDRLVAETG